MEKSCRTSPSVQHCTVALPTPSEGAGASSTGKSKGAVNSLTSAASGLTPAKREENSLLREATTLTQVSGFTSSGTQAATSCPSHNRSFTSKAVMCAGLDIRLVDAVARGASRFENLLAPPKTYWPPQKLTGPFLKTKLVR